jgi:2-haloacid dehalogenase
MQQQSNQMKTALVFDYGGVLVDWDPRYLYRKIIPGDEQAIEKFLKEVRFFEWNVQQDAGRPFHQAIDEICTRYPQHCELIKAYDERYEESISGPIWPTVEILKELKLAGYPLYGLSNWPAEKFPPVRDRYEFFGWFEDIVISGEVGLAKPDPAIFQLMLARIGRPAEECIYIDDSDSNVAVAGQLGFQTIHFVSPAELRLELAALGIMKSATNPGSE